MSDIKKADSNEYLDMQATQASQSQQVQQTSNSGKEIRTVGRNLKEALELYKSQKGEEMSLEIFKTPFGKAMANKMEEVMAEAQRSPEFAELLKDEKLWADANPELLARLENELLAKEKSAERYVGPKTIGLILLLMLLSLFGKERKDSDFRGGGFLL